MDEKEYILRADVLWLIYSGKIMTGDNAEDSAQTLIKDIPAADVRHVVRCKDCRHRDPEDHKCDCGQLERAGCAFPVDDEYYCAYGEE